MVALWAGRLVLVEVDRERVAGVGAVGAGMAGGVAAHRGSSGGPGARCGRPRRFAVDGYPASMRCPAGSRSRSASMVRIGIVGSATAAWVVTTLVIRFGGWVRSVVPSSAGVLSQVSPKWTLFRSSLRPRFSL